MTKRTGPTKGDRMRREFPIDQTRAIDEENRTVEIAFSSEMPGERFFGLEVLSHNRNHVRLQRLQSGAAVLVNHDMDQQVGVVESARIDDDRVGRAVIRFGRSAFAEEIFRDVVDGIRKLVSVGYRVHDIEEPPRGGDTFRVIDWEPHELSLVAVPMDDSVGVGRSINPVNNEEIEMPENTDALDERDNTASLDEGGGVTETRSEETTEDTRETQVRARVDADILALGKKFKQPDLARELIELGGSVEDMMAGLRQRAIERKPTPAPAVRSLHVTGGAPRYKGLKAFRSLGEEAAYRAGMWARATLFQDETAARWCNENYTRVMTTAAISKGGAVVPEEMSQAIIDLREQYGVARRLLRVVPMNSDVLQVPRRVSGVTAYFVGEEDATTESDKSWDMVQLTARKLASLTRFSRDYAEDAVIDVAEDLANEQAYAFAEKEDDCLINGDGTSTYGGIYGFRPKIINGSYTAGAVDGASGIDTYAEVTGDDLDNVRAVLPVYASMNAKWLASRQGKTLVFDALARAAGGNTKTDIGGRLADAYLGDEIVQSQKMPTSTGDLSNVAMLLYGDFEKAATMGDRRGFRMQVLVERYAEYDQIGIIGTERFDINVHDLGDTSTAGPVVALVGE